MNRVHHSSSGCSVTVAPDTRVSGEVVGGKLTKCAVWTNDDIHRNEPAPVCWWLALFVLGGGGHYWWHGIVVVVFSVIVVLAHGERSQMESAVRMMDHGWWWKRKNIVFVC